MIMYNEFPDFLVLNGNYLQLSKVEIHNLRFKCMPTEVPPFL